MLPNFMRAVEIAFFVNTGLKFYYVLQNLLHMQNKFLYTARVFVLGIVAFVNVDLINKLLCFLLLPVIKLLFYSLVSIAFAWKLPL